MCSVTSETIKKVYIRMREKRSGIYRESRVETVHQKDGFILSYKTSFGKVISRKYTYKEINETWKKVNHRHGEAV